MAVVDVTRWGSTENHRRAGYAVLLRPVRIGIVEACHRTASTVVDPVSTSRRTRSRHWRNRPTSETAGAEHEVYRPAAALTLPRHRPMLPCIRLNSRRTSARRRITGVSRTALYSFMSTRGLRPKPSSVFLHESGRYPLPRFSSGRRLPFTGPAVVVAVHATLIRANGHAGRRWDGRAVAPCSCGTAPHPAPDAWCSSARASGLLVLGNHDVDPVNQVRPVEVHRTAGTLGRGRRPAVAADARAVAAGAGRLRQRARTRAPEGIAEQKPTHQRKRRAVELPARAVRHQAAGPPAAGRKNRPRAQHPGAAEHRGNHHAMTMAEANAAPRCQPRHERAMSRDETGIVQQTMGWKPVPVRGWPR